MSQESVKKLTLGSHEKSPFFIDMAGSPETIGGFCCKFRSSAENSTSKRCKETFAFATCQKILSVDSKKLLHILIIKLFLRIGLNLFFLVSIYEKICCL
jgi:hypothetical protein